MDRGLLFISYGRGSEDSRCPNRVSNYIRFSVIVDIAVFLDANNGNVVDMHKFV